MITQARYIELTRVWFNAQLIILCAVINYIVLVRRHILMRSSKDYCYNPNLYYIFICSLPTWHYAMYGKCPTLAL